MDYGSKIQESESNMNLGIMGVFKNQSNEKRPTKVLKL